MAETASGPPVTDWEELIKHWLHDPPDKALDIKGHEARAVRYLTAALGHQPSGARDSRETKTGDIDSSIADRLPLPDPGAAYQLAVAPENGVLRRVHPLSGEPFELPVSEVDPTIVVSEIRGLVSHLDDMRLRYLALWRLLPERLAARQPCFASLPAETRVPDHTIWQHLDATAGLALAHMKGSSPAFLSFVLGPVQPFIAAARSLRDLWTGSALLSWLTFQGIRPILETLGPTSLVFPALRGAPLADLWLCEQGLDGLVPAPSREKLSRPSLPHRFVAVVPAGPKGAWAKWLAERCRESCLRAWRELSDEACATFKKVVGDTTFEWEERWSREWKSQAESYFSVHMSVLPWKECSEEFLARLYGKPSFDEAFPNVGAVRRLSQLIPKPGQAASGAYGETTGRWQTLLDMSARVMEEHRRLRHVPSYQPEPDAAGRFAPKCSLFGTYEQIGPAELGQGAKYWAAVSASQTLKQEGVRLDENERFCAVALTKRLTPAGLLGDKLKLRLRDLRFADTASLAAADWLEEQNLDPEALKEWNGQWLHLPRARFVKEKVPDEVAQAILAARQRAGQGNAPPAYYAIIQMDGDRMGHWLRGELAPTLEEVYHPKIADYLLRLEEVRPIVEEAKRPVSPALHAAISQALASFAVEIAPQVVELHKGSLVYCGGDDLLALVPCRRAASCARELERRFRSESQQAEDGRLLTLMGSRATTSGGIAIVHYKNDLRDSIAQARSAERKAKEAGRDAVAVSVVRRSGERHTVLLRWEELEDLDRWVKIFSARASDRWAYQLLAESTGFSLLPREAVEAELRRRIARSDEKTKRAIVTGLGAGAEKPKAEELVAGDYRRFVDGREARSFAGHDSGDHLAEYLGLIQAAAFIARGREEE